MSIIPLYYMEAEDRHIKKKNAPFSAFIIPGTKIVNFLLKRYFLCRLLEITVKPD